MTAYHQPSSLADALTRLAAEPGLVVLAGATDIYPARTSRAGWGVMRHADILDISRIPDLAGIARTSGGWRIGATTTWTTIARADLPPAFDGLKAAARDIGGTQIQNRGTIAGNLCTASPAGDSIPCLLTLDAEVVLASLRGERRLPLSRFLDGYRHTARAPDEIVTAVIVPQRPGRGTFLKLGARRYLVISIAMAAARIARDATGRITDAAIAVGACAPVAARLPALEQRLVGAVPDPSVVQDSDLAHLAPIDDVRATAAYRRAAALELVRDLIAASAVPESDAAAGADR